jgi:hypothetical protein
VILDRTFAVGEIISEDLPRVSVADVSIEEGNNGVKALYFTVSLSETHSANISMAYRTLDGTAKSGSDYRGVSGLLVIPAGVQTGTIRIDILGDTIIEDNETFTLKLEAASQATIVDDTAIATIRNDDTEQGISIADGGVMEGNTGRKSMFFSVSLAQPSTSFITIYYATQNGSATTADRDYVAVSGQVSIRPGGRSAVIEVPILGDRKIETDENFFVQLVRAFGAVISSSMMTQADSCHLRRQFPDSEPCLIQATVRRVPRKVLRQVRPIRQCSLRLLLAVKYPLPAVH